MKSGDVNARETRDLPGSHAVAPWHQRRQRDGVCSGLETGDITADDVHHNGSFNAVGSFAVR